MASLLLAYVVPLFVVFNITGLIGTFSEHHWGTLLDKPARLRLVLLQQSRFLLDEVPDPTLPAARRVGPRTEEWTNSTYERFDHLENGCKGFTQYPHTHAWSIGEAIERVFERMAAAPPPELAPWGPAQFGSLTTVTKKLSMWRTTSMKRSKSTGLLT